MFKVTFIDTSYVFSYWRGYGRWT